MASTATTRLGLRKQGTGDNEDTWGTELNDDVIDLTDEAVAGVETISLTGNKTLTSTNYATNEARNAALRLTDGGLSAAPTITIPAVEKTYLVHNTTAYIVTFSSGGTDATVPASRWALVYCDGTDVYSRSLFQSEDQASYAGSYEYTFSTTTDDADPGAGFLRLDNATASSATGIYINDSEQNGTDISALMLTWDDSTSTVKGYIKVQSKATPATFYVYSVSALTDNTGYMDFTVAYVAGAGTLANNEEIIVSFARTGDKGETGATGSTGTVSAAGDGTVAAPGFAWASDSDTGFWRRGSGEIGIAVNGVTAAVVTGTGVTMDVAVDMNGNEFSQAIVRDTSGKHQAVGTTASNTTFDVSAYASGSIEPTGNITISFSNWPASGDAYFTLEGTGLGDHTITWTGITWDGGSAPTLSTTTSVDKLVFFTRDAGSTVRGKLVWSS